MLTLSSRHDITLDAYRRVAWERETVELSPEALNQMAAAHRGFLGLLESDPDLSVYMVTTGGGEWAKQRVSPGEWNAGDRPRNFNLELAFGEPLPERVTRGFVLARLANFLGGHTAAHPSVAEAIAGLLDGRPLPPVPRHGQGGSGEIIPLGHLMSGIRKVATEPKAMNALVNGSPCAAALVADAVLAARERLALAADAFALSIEAIKAPLENYSSALEDLWNDPAETSALQALRSRLGGAGAVRRAYQTPVSWRIVPRVLGQGHRALDHATDVARRSLASVTDNPVYVPPDADHALGRTFSTGGFHNSAAGPALDALSATWADLCLLAERHCGHLFDHEVSLLPDKLVVGDAHLFYLNFVQVGIGEEARRAVVPSLIPPSSGGFAQSDVAAPSFLAWEQQQRAAECFDAAMAILAAVGSQALFVTDRHPPDGLAGFVSEVRRHFPPVVEARALGQGVDALVGAFRARIYGPQPAALPQELKTAPRWS
jgi:histidine ammonia-lyase